MEAPRYHQRSVSVVSEIPMRLDVAVRVTGSILVVVSYFILVHVSLNIGIVLQTFADAITVPYFVRTKSWDVVVMLSFLFIVSLSKILPIDMLYQG